MKGDYCIACMNECCKYNEYGSCNAETIEIDAEGKCNTASVTGTFRYGEA